MDIHTTGQVAFEAYCASVQGQTYDGKPIPSWANLTEAVRTAWEAAAEAVMVWIIPGYRSDLGGDPI